MVGLVARHERFFCNGQATYVARVVAFAADGMTVRQKKGIASICTNLSIAFGTSKALNMPEFSGKLNDALFDAVLVNATIASSAVGFWQLTVHFMRLNGIEYCLKRIATRI